MYHSGASSSSSFSVNAIKIHTYTPKRNKRNNNENVSEEKSTVIHEIEDIHLCKHQNEIFISKSKRKTKMIIEKNVLCGKSIGCLVRLMKNCG